jgi:hypothetical protein
VRVTGEWVFETVEPPALPPPPEPGSSTPPRRRRRARFVRLGVLILVVTAIASALALTLREPGGRGVKSPVAPPTGTPALAWSVYVERQAFVAAIAVPLGKPPIVIVIPASTSVDIPGGGPATVGAAAREDPKLMLAAVQATVNRRVPHYLSTGATGLLRLVDRLGGVQVQVEAAFTSKGVTVPAGSRHLTGSQVVAYLEGATARDRTGRWEEVLVGLLSGTSDPWRWAGALGASDDAGTAARVLASAHGAQMVDLPTTLSFAGLQTPDTKAVAGLVDSQMAGLGGPLVRVAVLRGTARRLNVPDIAALLAPEGFRVTAAPTARLLQSDQTRILATAPTFLPQARQVQALIGVGKVYMAAQPSGIADIEIVLGKDFRGG